MPVSSMPVDFLIIGQGMAGSLLAWSLIKAGYSVHIVDNNHAHSSSVVAAGLINPLAGKRLVKPDDCVHYLQQLQATYSGFETYFSRQFYFPVEMLRFMKEASQQDFLKKRQADPAYSDLIAEVFSADEDTKPLVNRFGGCIQQQTGYLDIPALLTSLNRFFHGQNIIDQYRVDYDEIKLEDQRVKYKQLEASFCIFCEGYQATANPWFKWLPFQPAKGEILTIEADQLQTEKIINRSNWLIPIGNNQFRTGSTNSWEFTDDAPTESGKKEIENNLTNLFIHTPEYKVVNHQAGVRPATRDKNPFIGFHPGFSQLGIFNGFGARGSLTIPWYSRIFTESINQQRSLPTTVDIRRFHS
ncbi:MAG: FAD-binding oxidoreductase [Gammaproteobacteria bacterium]|nr:FAD-binding oxidoreductase [Gammaproteobacteria bacterium]NNJ92447.1 FAD-binding oxidoreductase [Gammaproteobacteria bacterium]